MSPRASFLYAFAICGVAAIFDFACSDEASSASASSSSSSSSGSSDATSAEGGKAACYAWCDKQEAPKCPKEPAGVADACKAMCDATYASTPAECVSERAAVDVCARDKTSFACNGQGISQLQPIGACAAENAACSKCSPDAGVACFSPLSF